MLLPSNSASQRTPTEYLSHSAAPVLRLHLRQYISMSGMQAAVRTVSGQRLGNSPSSFLDPFILFKGKLRAAATRSKFHDSADLRWLADRHSAAIQARRAELNPQYIGLALKRYPELELLFSRLGGDITGAKHSVRDLSPTRLPAPAPGDVQRGLLG